MGKAIDLRGIHPPIPTPFEEDGSIAFEALANNLERWAEQPLAGYVVGGSNGEFVLLSEEERVAVVTAARPLISDRLLLAGVGTESTRGTIALGDQMAAAGADALLVVNPSYYRSLMTAETLVAHYRAVATASPLPVVLYNVPANTSVSIPVEAVVELADHPNVVGIKDSSGDLIRLAETIRDTPADFQVLAGSGSFILPALTLGAVGAVAAVANIAAPPLADLLTAFERGDHAEARAIQLRLLAINRAVTSGFGVPGLKAALELLGFYGGPVRGPLRPLGEQDRETLRALLIGAGLLAE